MRQIDAALLRTIALGTGKSELIQELVSELAAQLPAAGIGTPLRIAHFLAQACVETWNFTRLIENLNYRAEIIIERFPQLKARAVKLEHAPEALANAAYAGMNGNGDEASGDGWRFRGRGCFNLTGRFNYDLVGGLLRKAAGHAALDLVEMPDLLAEPALAVASAIAFWNLRHCNEAADADDTGRVTRAVNGGVNNLAERVFAKRRAFDLLTKGS